jgi:hypothetical protein
MNWLFPGFLAGAALIGLPVLLHLLRRKPRQEVRFPSLRFLGASALRDTRRHRLLRWLTLALRCLAIALLCAAFARPFWGASPSSQRRALVIALDNSMSQQATNRWDDTQRWALGELDALSPGDQAGLLVMQPEPAWLVPMTDDLGRVRTALAAAKPGFDKTRYAQPLRLAGDVLAKSSAGTKILAWAADEQRAGWRGTDLAQKLSPGVSFHFMGIAPAPARQATIVSVRKASQASEALDVVVRQFHQTPDQRELTISAGGKQIVKQTISLRAGDNKLNIPCAWPANTAGLRVALDSDDLPDDDAAWIAASPSTTNLVLLDAVSETDFLAHALRSTHKLDDGGFEPATLPGQAWPLGAPVVLRGEASFRDAARQRLNQYLNAGGAVWIFADGSATQNEWLEQQGVHVTKRLPENEPWHLRDWDAQHPALEAFARQSLLPLLEVEFYQGFNLSGDALAPIANWPDGKVALAELDSGGHRMLIAGFPAGREATDWMTKPSFVPFVHCVARWLGSFKDARDDWRVGDTIPLSEIEGTWRALDVPVPQPEIKVTGSIRPSAPGLYEFRTQGMTRIFAVNTPVEESDLSPWPNPDQLAALESPEKPAPALSNPSVLPTEWAAAENQQRLWWWLLAVGGVALLTELVLANRATL